MPISPNPKAFPGPMFAYIRSNSSLEGKYQSLLPLIDRLRQIDAASAPEHPFAMSIVFWAPVPIAVPSAPGM